MVFCPFHVWINLSVQLDIFQKSMNLPTAYQQHNNLQSRHFPRKQSLQSTGSSPSHSANGGVVSGGGSGSYHRIWQSAPSSSTSFSSAFSASTAVTSTSAPLQQAGNSSNRSPPQLPNFFCLLSVWVRGSKPKKHWLKAPFTDLFFRTLLLQLHTPMRKISWLEVSLIGWKRCCVKKKQR